MNDVIIIGGGPAGLAAGIYAGRAELKTIIIDKDSQGGQIAITSEVLNYPAIESISGPEFIMTMRQQATSFNAKIIEGIITHMELNGDIKKISLGDTTYEGKSVIIATGANPRKAGFDGEDKFVGRGVSYCAICDGNFFKGLDTFVIGGGYAACEEALYLSKLVRKVTMILRRDEFRAARSIVKRIEETANIEVIYNTTLQALTGEIIPEKAVFLNQKTNETWVYEKSSRDRAFGVFVFVGYIPTSDAFKDKIMLDDEGYIPTDDNMETNVKGVFAAGDIRAKPLRQLVTAVSDGAIAATQAEKHIFH